MTRRRLILIIAGVLSIAAIGSGWRTWDFVENDPQFCNSCHLMSDAYSKWQHGEHKAVNCHTCHIQNLADRTLIVWSWAIGRGDKVPPHTELAPQPCEGCHRTTDPRWPTIEGEVGHQVHVVRAKLQCLQCHHPTLHAFKPKAEDCRRCHSDATIKAEGMAEFHCTSCHKFTATDRKNMIPTKDDCLACHAAEGSKKKVAFTKDAAMKFDCAKCHNPHRSKRPVALDCLGCHKDILEDATHQKGGDLTACVSCHKNHHWTVDEEGKKAEGDGAEEGKTKG